MNPISIPGFSDPVSSATHLLAAVAALVGAFFILYRGRGNPARVFSLLIFSLSLVFLFSMSGVFHLLDRGGDARDVLQRLDHAGIWILIAGTITPIQVILFRSPWRWPILALVWVIAVTGLVLEVVFFESFPEWLLLSFFLGLGWMGAFSAVNFTRAFRGASVRLLVVGGILYTLGATIDFIRHPVLIEGVIGPHEIFHIFVVLAAMSHWLFIYTWCDHPLGNVINFQVQVFPGGQVLARACGEPLEIRADSVGTFRKIVVAQVAQRFHSSIRPQIQLHYVQVEYL